MNIPKETLEQQHASSNPLNSAWVSANAGSGKTHVLTQRVIRLMLAGNPPDKILCLTFTKAAAANMKNRVFDTLAKWTMMADEQLEEEIRKTSNEPVTPQLKHHARQLFALALDTPGGLKIQTIHSFCESLLHQFPLEANVPGHFEALQESEQANLLESARTHVLSKNINGAANHYAQLVPMVTDATIEKGLNAIIYKRQDFKLWSAIGLELAFEKLYKKFGIEKTDTPQSIREACVLDILTDGKRLSQICARGALSDKPTDINTSDALQKILETRDFEATFELAKATCLTGSNTIKSERSLITKFIKDELPEAVEALQLAGEKVLNAIDKLKAIQLIKCSWHLFHIGEAVLFRYEALKRQRGAIDFDDQIDKSATLLTRSDIRDWIRYRLDNGIDHLLVDEAQDTSPRQWAIINAITEDFHAGESAGNEKRTVFVVGDEKQSIFSFQGAEPGEFSHQERQLKRKVEAADKPYHAGRLSLSFRSTQDVLHAVDAVFEVAKNLNGLTRSGESPVHDAVRKNDPGEVQIWPVMVQEKPEETESWLDPVDKTSDKDGAVLLAEKIASKIEAWVGKPLPGMDRPLTFGDILVLVRKRDRFLSAFTRTMKDKGLAIAGEDRLTLTTHIAIEDLLAVGRFALLPEDDLSLACILKSPLFSIDEDTLFEFANGRKGASLFDNIRTIANTEDHKQCALAGTLVSQLETIITLASGKSVFDFYATLLGRLEGRKKMLARLGMEAEDILDAFMDETLDFSNTRNGGLETFITEITSAEPVIKREVELERDEVRVLTVHSSKGLEARAVFLVDHCGQAWTEKHRPSLLELKEENAPNGFIWLPSSDLHTHATRASTEIIRKEAEAEYRRLLYVGMTRAADRLVVCGYKKTEKTTHPHWHQMVKDALMPKAVEVQDAQGELDHWRWVSKEQPAIKPKPYQAEETLIGKTGFPRWLLEPAKSDPPLPRPLTPSGAHALIDPDQPVGERLALGEHRESNSFALKKGNVTHKLLEVLPEIAPEKRISLATEYLSKTCPDWHESQRSAVLEKVLAIFSDNRFKALFEGEARAEVSLAGRLDVASGSMLVTGQVDRLIVAPEHVTILDYKTNLAVPQALAEVPEEYLTQLALYRDLVSRIYPEKALFSALLWTQAPDLMQIPDEMLDHALDKVRNG